LTFGKPPSARKKPVRSWFVVTIISVGLLIGTASFLNALKPVEAQNNSDKSVPVKPNDESIIGGPNVNAPGTSPSLQCQGCHAPGKPLPYLAGSLFHTAHSAYDQSFHARTIHNGSKAAACLDCHAKNGDMTTMLPAVDPKSTINRTNIAETCGKCPGMT
jgi:hypothetical protein